MGYILSKFRHFVVWSEIPSNFGAFQELIVNSWSSILPCVVLILYLLTQLFPSKAKPSIKDTLEKIETDLRKLSRFQYDTELQQKRIVGRVVLGGICLYTVCLVLAYFFGPRDLSWKQTLGFIVPFVLFPILIITIKRGLGWYFNRKIEKNKDKYESLKKEKQRILDEVMDKETFKVAKEILEKYAPNHLLPKFLAEQQRAPSLTPVPRAAPGLRRRSNPPISSTPYNNMGGFTPRAIRPYGPPGSGPSGPGQFLRQPTNNFMRPAIMPPPNSTPGGSPGSSQVVPMLRGPPPPRFMLPPIPTNPEYRSRKTGWIDKMVDYVVGDGPANRFALICRYCATHNGLATPEDFPYIGYRCVYCRQFNPPRQQRPSAATLPRNTVLIEELDSTNKTPESSFNENETSVNKEKDISSQEGSPQKEGEETEEKEPVEPVIELAASSTEDLTRSVESLRVESEEQSGIEDLLQNEDEDEDSQGDNFNNTLQENEDANEEAKRFSEEAENKSLESVDDGESQETTTEEGDNKN
ncbi:Protein lunapark-B [Orchesella cincta]|uniref:Endoplasmic reticulum junction formation protein lunapark n=1 Tax=Orchesella cincta TaxID=48709 RepID=A0A1D2MGA7_ORCCI|nr:Protein lunapark-B [Orchesella cincta]